MRQPRPYSVQASVWNGVAVIFQDVLDLLCPTVRLYCLTHSPNCESGMTHREEREEQHNTVEDGEAQSTFANKQNKNKHKQHTCGVLCLTEKKKQKHKRINGF
jgi:hypothetical protein